MIKIETLSGNVFEPTLPKNLLKIADEICAANGRAFLVGGWVRDALLGKTCRDYDIEVYDIEQDILLSILKKYGRTNLVGKAFGVIHLAMKGCSLDFSFPRTESKIGYGHRGFVVHTNKSLSFKEAALRRDFTINAMGIELPSLKLCDPYGGVNDLKSKTLRHVSEAFAEDSLRILRGVQFASRFKLTLAPETIEICKTLSLNDLSIERIFEEFKKWLLKPGSPSFGLRAFLAIGLNDYFTEIKPLNDSSNGWQLLGELLDNLSCAIDSDSDKKMVIMFAALLSGNKNDSLKFLTRITNETKILRKVPLLLQYAFSIQICRPIKLPLDSEIRKLSVALLGLSELSYFIECNPLIDSNIRIEFATKFRERARALNVYDAAPTPYVTGQMLTELGLKPGKCFGDIIKQSFELQLNGAISNKIQAQKWAESTVKNLLTSNETSH